MNKPVLFGSLLSSLLMMYFFVKPAIPRRLRYWLRRFLAWRTLRRTTNWPINPGTEAPPSNWSGWPDNKKFAVVLTHDVEGKAGLDLCPQLAKLEMSLGFRSSFNFVPEGEYRVSREFLESLVRQGFEVGVHDLHHDGSLFQSREDFIAQAEKINRYLAEWGAVGFRAGFMFHDLNWLHHLNTSYDSSTFDVDPFEPQPDGAHTIFPFWVEGPRSQGYIELPYTLAQDSTLFLLLRERSIAIWKRKLDWIAERGGMVLLNVHPDYMTFDRSRESWGAYPASYYAELLEYVKQRYDGDYWQALPREVAEYCATFKPRVALSGVSHQPIAEVRPVYQLME
jgi:hypothetical protein